MSDWDLAEANFDLQNYCLDYQRELEENAQYTCHLEELDRKRWINAQIYKPNLRFV